jgi:hypothetical protein
MEMIVAVLAVLLAPSYAYSGADDEWTHDETGHDFRAEWTVCREKDPSWQMCLRDRGWLRLRENWTDTLDPSSSAQFRRLSRWCTAEARGDGKGLDTPASHYGYSAFLGCMESFFWVHRRHAQPQRTWRRELVSDNGILVIRDSCMEKVVGVYECLDKQGWSQAYRDRLRGLHPSDPWQRIGTWTHNGREVQFRFLRPTDAPERWRAASEACSAGPRPPLPISMAMSECVRASYGLPADVPTPYRR